MYCLRRPRVPDRKRYYVVQTLFFEFQRLHQAGQDLLSVVPGYSGFQRCRGDFFLKLRIPVPGFPRTVPGLLQAFPGAQAIPQGHSYYARYPHAFSQKWQYVPPMPGSGVFRKYQDSPDSCELCRGYSALSGYSDAVPRIFSSKDRKPK